MVENKRIEIYKYLAEKFHKLHPSWLLTLIQDQPVSIKMISTENRYFPVLRLLVVRIVMMEMVLAAIKMWLQYNSLRISFLK